MAQKAQEEVYTTRITAKKFSPSFQHRVNGEYGPQVGSHLLASAMHQHARLGTGVCPPGHARMPVHYTPAFHEVNIHMLCAQALCSSPLF